MSIGSEKMKTENLSGPDMVITSEYLKWIFERLEGKDNFEDRPYGRIPKKGALDVSRPES